MAVNDKLHDEDAEGEVVKPFVPVTLVGPVTAAAGGFGGHTRLRGHTTASEWSTITVLVRVLRTRPPNVDHYPSKEGGGAPQPRLRAARDRLPEGKAQFAMKRQPANVGGPGAVFSTQPEQTLSAQDTALCPLLSPESAGTRMHEDPVWADYQRA